MNVPTTLTNKLRTLGAEVAAVGDADVLKAAFDAGTQVTLDGKFAGERVYLGYRHQVMGDDGVTVERVGLDQILGESPKFPGHTIAVYCIDVTRLDDAPRLAELARKARNASMDRAARVEARVEAEDQRLSRPAE